MKSRSNKKYKPNEVLQILIDFYNFQLVHDPEVYGRKNGLTFSTTIKDWRSICDLEEPGSLAEGYIAFFDLKGETTRIRDIILNEEKHTLKEFCYCISKKAVREDIEPIKSFGGVYCEEAAIFKALKVKLEQRGVDTSNFKPSAALTPFFKKNSVEVLEIVTKLAPGTIRQYEEKKGKPILGWLSVLLIFTTIILAFVSGNNWFYLILLPPLLFLFNGKASTEIKVNSFESVRDLIREMKVQLFPENTI